MLGRDSRSRDEQPGSGPDSLSGSPGGPWAAPLQPLKCCTVCSVLPEKLLSAAPLGEVPAGMLYTADM